MHVGQRFSARIQSCMYTVVSSEHGVSKLVRETPINTLNVTVVAATYVNRIKKLRPTTTWYHGNYTVMS